MSYHAHQHLPNNSWSSNDDDFEYPEPNYPYLYASSVGHVTPAVSSAPLPPPSNAPSHHSSAFVSTRGGKGRRIPPERAYSDTSRTSGDSYITPSVSISQVGNRQRHASHASKSRSRATSFASRENLRPVPTRQQTDYTATSQPSTIVTRSPRSHEAFSAEPSRSGQVVRRLRSVLKKPRPPVDSESYTSSSSTPMVVPQPRIQPRIVSSPPSRPTELERPESPAEDRQSMALSSTVQRTRFHGQSVQVSEHLRKPWDARSPPRFNSSVRAAPAFDNPNVRSINLIVPGLPWSVHVRARTSGKSGSRSRSRHDRITVGDVVDSVYASLNKSLTRTDVRAASSKTKKMIANAAAAAEVESERGEHSARRGKPSAARRIDFLGPRIWFKGLTKDDSFAREEGYGITEGELERVWVMIFAETKHQHQVRSATL